MSPKTMIIAAAAIAAASVVALSASAAPPADPAAPPSPSAPASPMHPAPLRATILFNLLDRNGDGAIDQDELAALTKAIFSAVDANGDGKITAEEFDRALPALAGGGQPPRMGQFMHHGQGFHRFGMMGPRFHRPGDNRQGLLENDQGPGPQQQLGDNDAQPQIAGPQQDFASLDKNGDGVLSPDEFSAAAPAIPGVPPAPASAPAQ